ncbi:sugar phosphate isomerase/epimerase [Panacibacter sp. DH6]|uniref:Sugar phosphate isomerase/epimerase n=1 Tax=Panacibacter microcysteis TaxID=2793269 RepID=A0A931GV35_9BACT|nr:sugar phosphate isomerase/epimerase family protein [Panacibacter microcysteis]MBG9377366.1 sugar phosphate isomerase/epimerase [Panacibacter microcysteis]
MLNRRELLKLSGAATLASFIPSSFVRAAPTVKGPFRFCLNTSTIMGQKPGLLKSIDIAAKAGYDGLELWINDINDHLAGGHSVQSLNAFIQARKLQVYNLISFTSWMVDDDDQRNAAVAQLEAEMKTAAAIGCKRIAAPPVGVEQGAPLDIQKTAERYKTILELGKKYGVMPLLEFWGASGTLYNFSQALAVAAATDHADAKILPDVYHLFRGGSGFNCLQLVNGNVIDVIHMNDYPGKPAAEQNDSDRVYPGDGIAPVKEVLHSLKKIGGTKVLSLELFNETYWKQDAMLVAKTGLQKMQYLVNEVMAGK